MKRILTLLCFALILTQVFFFGCSEEKASCKHSYSAWTIEVEPDCVNAGTKTRTCSKCKEKDVQSIPALGHNFVDGVCTVCGADE